MDLRDEPRRLGPYRLLTQVGEGGMGVVHLGLDPEGRAVAVKVMRAHLVGDEVGRARLGREVTSLRRVVGPHVAEVLDADVESPTPYVVMRYVAGPPLPQVVASTGPLAGDELIRLARGLARGLVTIHAAGVVHRDLKPGNVLMADGEPIVIDFGLAQLADDARLTMTGLLVGTPGFLAPEILSGAPATSASDVHAWGATMAYAATGRSPYGTGPMEAVLHRVMSREIDVEGLPPWLEVLVDAATHLEPGHRPSARELVSAIATMTSLTTPTSSTVLGATPQAAGADDAQLPVSSWQDVPADRTRVLDRDPTRSLTFPQGGGATAVMGVAPAPLTKVDMARPVVRPPVERLSLLAEPRDLFAHPPDHHPHVMGAGVAPSAQLSDPAATRQPRPHPVLGALVVAAGAIAAAVAPFVMAGVALLVLVLLRLLEGAVRGHERRRAAYGPRRSDGARSAAAAPWHLLRALATTVATLPLAAGAGVLTLVLGWLFLGGTLAELLHGAWLSAPRPQQPTDIAVGAAAFVTLATAVLGPATDALRSGFDRVVDEVAPSREARAVAAALVVAAAGLAAVAAASSDAWLWPYTG